jgi:Response regulators consisting of a CheY-like receiver domain and a winged-helix DNA-binding domain|nr:response regulator transcription factor [uncultured Steroidobacter sp.]
MTNSPVEQPVTRAHDGVRVALVEDDHELREALAENLRLNGIEVAQADSARTFFEALRASPIDVAIIDVNLPDASGFELARGLARGEARPGVIILTARVGHHDRRQGYAEGADLYMTKPVDSEELLLAVRNLARRVRDARGTPAQSGADHSAWTLDVARKLLLSPRGVSIVLSGREVLLLEQFIKAAGEPVSRASLAAIMGYGMPGPENRGLDAALRRLRDKAAAQGLELPLLIIHSIGIRFVAPFRLS